MLRGWGREEKKEQWDCFRFLHRGSQLSQRRAAWLNFKFAGRSPVMDLTAYTPPVLTLLQENLTPYLLTL
ncbi:hypothetical protein Pmani_024995 [Petrolisthes manimaculis]|uniref:Uncharacterized protein n=1 Tax=Petrolisthes manimaculis TaxID=1843537 RepID=A0AAE1P733_9EUCA|nr:hypothetical protein Pmani_024995 [Petrolisthes manimaculis]